MFSSSNIKSAVKIGVIVLLIGIAAFYINSSFRGEKQKIDQLNRITGEKAEAAIKAAENFFTFFRDKNFKKLDSCILTDEEGKSEIKNILAELTSPDFAEAEVVSPEFNKDIFYVTVPVPDKQAFQFIIRKKRERLMLLSVTWSNK
jgi:hypothetical protein